MNTTCPFCNSLVVPTNIAAGKASCPRCAERFPVATSAAASMNGVLPPSAPSSINRKSSNRRVALLIVAAMFVIGAGVLAYVLKTRPNRGLTFLAEKPALGYLPDDTNAILLLNVPTAQKHAQSDTLISKTGFGPGGTFDLQKFTGLTLDQIEDAVLGLRIDDNLLPKFRLIVRTRSSYDADELRKRLHSQRQKQEGAKRIDLVKPQGVPFELTLWCATSRTFVLTLDAEDMAKVPDEPNPRVERLPGPIPEFLRLRSEKDTFFFLVAHADDWTKTSMPLFLRLLADERRLVYSVQSLAIGMRMDSGTITSRARPARVTEEPTPEGRRVAFEVVFFMDESTAVDVRNAFEAKIETHGLEVKDSSLDKGKYASSIAGQPAQLEALFRDLQSKFIVGK